MYEDLQGRNAHVCKTTIGNGNEHDEEEHQPRLGVQECLDHLLRLESLVLDTGLIGPNTVDRDGPLALRDEFRRDRVIWEEEASDTGPYNGYDARDPEEPSPLLAAEKSDARKYN